MGGACPYIRVTPEMWSGSQHEQGAHSSGFEAGSYLRLIDSCITQLKAQGPSRACNKSKEEDERSLVDNI